MNNLQNTFPTLYGAPPGPKHSYSLMLIVGALLGGIIAWLLGNCSGISHPTLYGPPPVDSIQPPSPINNEY